ncbi:MAG TPA: hypothetical protein VFR24_22035 [Candidatus Angelobacter sp.]|nr:hypothetical protein [Candidatus Angelobacter sp.]
MVDFALSITGPRTAPFLRGLGLDHGDGGDLGDFSAVGRKPPPGITLLLKTQAELHFNRPVTDRSKSLIASILVLLWLIADC